MGKWWKTNIKYTLFFGILSFNHNFNRKVKSAPVKLPHKNLREILQNKKSVM